MYIWQLCDIRARNFVGIAGQVRPIRLEAVRAECDHTDNQKGNFHKFMLIEAILFPAKYLKMISTNYVGIHRPSAIACM